MRRERSMGDQFRTVSAIRAKFPMDTAFKLCSLEYRKIPIIRPGLIFVQKAF